MLELALTVPLFARERDLSQFGVSESSRLIRPPTNAELSKVFSRVGLRSLSQRLLSLINDRSATRTAYKAIQTPLKKEGDHACSRPPVELCCSHWMVMERLLELPEPGF